MNTDGNKQCQCAYSLQIYSRRWSYWKAKNHTSSWWNKKTWGQRILLTLRLLVVSTLFWFVIGSIYLPDWRSNSMPHYFFLSSISGFFLIAVFLWTTGICVFPENAIVAVVQQAKHSDMPRLTIASLSLEKQTRRFYSIDELQSLTRCMRL